MDKKKLRRLSVVFGVVLLVIAVLLASGNIMKNIRAGIASNSIMRQWDTEIEKQQGNMFGSGDDSNARNDDDKSSESDQKLSEEDHGPELVTIDVDNQLLIGVVKIPDVGIELPVISEFNDDALSKAPCRYTGSCFTNDMVITGHNVDNHFAPLHNLKIGAKMSFVTVDGYDFNYELTKTEVIDPFNIDGMITREGWDMTLFTCMPGGESRLALRFSRIDK